MIRRRDWAPLLRHAVLGGGCLGLNLLLMWGLVELLGADVLVATAACFVVLNVFSHHVSRAWVFGLDAAVTDASRREVQPYHRSLLRYLAGMGVSLGLNLALMAVAVRHFGMPYLFASILIAAVFFIGNFVLHRDWTFRA